MYRKLTKDFLPRLEVGTRIFKYPTSSQQREEFDINDTHEIAALLVIHITGPGYELYTGVPDDAEDKSDRKDVVHKSLDEIITEGRYWVNA